MMNIHEIKTHTDAFNSRTFFAYCDRNRKRPKHMGEGGAYGLKRTMFGNIGEFKTPTQLSIIHDSGINQLDLFWEEKGTHFGALMRIKLFIFCSVQNSRISEL